MADSVVALNCTECLNSSLYEVVRLYPTVGLSAVAYRKPFNEVLHATATCAPFDNRTVPFVGGDLADDDSKRSSGAENQNPEADDSAAANRRARRNRLRSAMDFPHRAVGAVSQIWHVEWGETPGERSSLRVLAAATEQEGGWNPLYH